MSSPILTSIIIRSSITDTRPDRHPLAVNRISPDKRNALEVHNRARRSQNLQPLQWDQKLCDAAARWARHLATERKFHHSHDSGHGENLFWISSSSAPYLAAARDWIDEAKYYHGERIGEGDMASYGHYSELRCVRIAMVFADNLFSSMHVACYHEGGYGCGGRFEGECLGGGSVLSTRQLDWGEALLGSRGLFALAFSVPVFEWVA